MTHPTGVTVQRKELILPTYPALSPDPNPMFFEKRVNQGSSGRIYPMPFTDQLSNEKVDRAYQAIFLENETIQLILLPELGGRIFAGLDKVNQYDFFYRHRVIKPALIGLLGPWISGGVEFNWPQHHRPSTYMPTDDTIETHADGSITVWMSEHDPLNRTKGMVGVCLYPGKALVETKVRLYNRTPHVQTFLWWENTAVHINDHYQVFFPPDVHSIVFHARSFTNHFPIVKGFYAGENFGAGTDVSFYKNIHFASSFFATESRYDFFGGYDHQKQAGVVHVANRHISPGKKFFTWANGPFGHRWQRNLADADDPYLELMAGVYTDNQPDFAWLHPYETKTFSQYWYPVKHIGPPKNATLNAAVNLEYEASQARLSVCATQDFPAAVVCLKHGDKIINAFQVDLQAVQPFQTWVEIPPDLRAADLTLQVVDRDGVELVSYTPEAVVDQTLPRPAEIPPLPEAATSTEELYLIGLHLEQYRHATLSPEPYWLEALCRDPGDARCNLALGRWRLRQGRFDQAEAYLRAAITRLTRWNFNPNDGEAHYQLGQALAYQGKLDEAYAAYYKSIWNYAWQSAGYTALAEIDLRRGETERAIDHLDRALQTNQAHLKARNLKTALLRRLGRLSEASALVESTLQMDRLDIWALNEQALIAQAGGQDGDGPIQALVQILGDDLQTILDIAYDYAAAGLFAEAEAWLVHLAGDPHAEGKLHPYPMIAYTLGYFARQRGQVEQALAYYQQASEQPPDYCFPFRLDEMLVLQDALSANAQDARAAYYLGNLLYDKDRHAEAERLWETAARLEPGFAIPFRNLGLAAYNHRRDLPQALAAYRQAFQANPNDPRLLFELDQIMQRAAVDPVERLAQLEAYHSLVFQRDDLVLQYATLCNRCGQPDRALEVLLKRAFHPWEGGEGSVSRQYDLAHWIIGREALENGQTGAARQHFEAALDLPEMLGDPRYLETETPLLYYLGLVHEAQGDLESARERYHQAIQSKPHVAIERYYQALALRKLGNVAAARDEFNALLAEAKKLAEWEDPNAYFEAHMPSILFIDDLKALRQVDSLFLSGLALLGLGRPGEAKANLAQTLTLDPNHQLAWEEYRRLP